MSISNALINTQIVAEAHSNGKKVLVYDSSTGPPLSATGLFVGMDAFLVDNGQ